MDGQTDIKAKDVYVTGAGIISALGVGKQETLEALLKQQSGVKPIRHLTTTRTEFPVGEVKFSNAEMKEMVGFEPDKAAVRSALLGIIAIKEALKQANINISYPLMRVAFISGITVGGMDQAELHYQDFLENDSKNDYIELNDCGGCTEQIADYFRNFSLVSTVVTACSSSANAIMLGADLIQENRADVVIAGGCECLSRYHLNGFNTLMILDREICKPFDRDRVGINLGEGAGYVVLESAETAQKRGVQPIGKISGYCNACDAFHQTASSPNGYGAFLAMKGALAHAGLKPEDIDYINAHGTGTPNNDLSEGRAMVRLFGDRMPLFSSTKAFTGHSLGAAGGIEAVLSVLAIRHGLVYPNLNFTQPMKELPVKPQINLLTNVPINHVLSNSFGFGGNCTALVFSKE